jgi:SAM-dependent methyltransferase
VLTAQSPYFDVEFSPALREVARLNGLPATRFFELGYGNGDLLRWAAARGFHCSGVETEPRLLERARKEGFDVFPSIEHAGDALAARSVGLAAAFDVLEHLPQADLLAALACVERLLIPGGVFVARFPNGDSPFSLLLQNGDATHVTAIGSLKITQLALAGGLTPLVIRNAAQPPVAGIGARLNRTAANAARFTIERALQNLYYQGRRVALGANLVVILQKPR